MMDSVKKYGFLVIVILLAFFMFTGCPEKTKQTTSGNENNIADVTDLQLALLNHISYKEELKNLIGKTIEGHDELIDEKYLENITGGTSLIDELKGYTVIDYDYGDPTGFNAAAFTKGNNLVLVYVGTSDGKDIIEDLKSGLFDFSVQDGQAKAFAKDNVKAHKHFNVYITGYSMGGRLCYLGAEELFDSVLAGNLKKVCTFNGLGVKEAFDITDGNLSNIHNLKFKFGDKASNYVVEGDFVSDLSTLTSFKFILGLEHIGKVHRIPCTNEIDDGVLKQHDLYSIIDYLLNCQKKADDKNEVVNEKGTGGNDIDSSSWEEAVNPSEIDMAYRAYLDFLQEHREMIDAFDWQKGYYGYGELTDEKLSRPVVFADFYGNEIPEMIYLDMNPSVDYAASLHIVGYENGNINQLFYSEYWDSQIAGGHQYYFFQLDGDKTLYYWGSSGDEDWKYCYGSFENTANGLALVEKYEHYLRPDHENGSGVIHEFTKDETQQITEAEYNDAVKTIEAQTASILMYTADCNDFANNFVAENACPAMSCEEAIDYLLGLLD